MSEGKHLIYNALQTPDGTIIESRHRHDYVTHIDKITGKEYMIDGGLAYMRFCDNGDAEMLSLYDDEPHYVQRQVLKWGTYGINGDQPLTLKAIADMDIGHLRAVLTECNPAFVYKRCMEKELKEREKELAEKQERERKLK